MILLGAAGTGGTIHAQESSPPCDETRPATWHLPAIEPTKDVASLLETQGWDTVGGKHIIPKVLAVKDVYRFSDPDADPSLSTCKAIVETDHGNFIYLFWYVDSPTGSHLHGQILDELAQRLPDNINENGIGPYEVGAQAAVNTYARILVDMVSCKLRSKAWADDLRMKVERAIPADRRELAAEFDATIKEEARDPDPDLCNGPDTRNLLRYGDGVVTGTRSVWSVFD